MTNKHKAYFEGSVFQERFHWEYMLYGSGYVKRHEHHLRREKIYQCELNHHLQAGDRFKMASRDITVTITERKFHEDGSCTYFTDYLIKILPAEGDFTEEAVERRQKENMTRYNEVRRDGDKKLSEEMVDVIEDERSRELPKSSSMFSKWFKR